MALPAGVLPRPDLSSDRRGSGQYYLYRVYEVPVQATLSGLNLEEGDALPDDSAAVITSASIGPDPKTGKACYVKLSAVKTRKWEG